MKVYTKRELNQNTAAVLASAGDHGEVIITERGEPRWRIAPLGGSSEDVLLRLTREGRFTPAASAPTPWPSEVAGPTYSSAAVDDLLDDMRGSH